MISHFVILIFSFGSTARASSVDVQTSRLQATDPMDMSSTRLNFAGATGYGAVKNFGVSTELNAGAGRDVQYHGLKGTGHARFEPARQTSLTLTSGANRLANEYPVTEASDEGDQVIGEDQTIPVYGAALRVGPGAWAVQADVAHDYVYQDWTQPRAATGLVNGTKFALAGELHTWRRVHVRGTVADVALNDRNEQRTGETTVLVDVLDRRDRIRLGAGVWYDDLLRRGRAYWTPRDFAAYTLRSESRLIVSKDLLFDVSANVGYGGERLKARDLSYALTAKLEYQVRAAWRVTLGCVRMEAFNPRGLSTWFRNDLYASLSAQL